jgi:hypothetical protein
MSKGASAPFLLLKKSISVIKIIIGKTYENA